MSGKFTVKNFSVVVPVFNEEDIVLQSAAQIYDICKRKELDFELIFERLEIIKFLISKIQINQLRIHIQKFKLKNSNLNITSTII